MVSRSSQGVVITLFRQALNIFIHSPENYPILGQVHKLVGWKQLELDGFKWLIPLVLSLTLDAMVGRLF